MIRFDTTLGDLISALYDAFLEDYGNETAASLGVALVLERLSTEI